MLCVIILIKFDKTCDNYESVTTLFAIFIIICTPVWFELQTSNLLDQIQPTKLTDHKPHTICYIWKIPIFHIRFTTEENTIKAKNIAIHDCYL